MRKLLIVVAFCLASTVLAQEAQTGKGGTAGGVTLQRAAATVPNTLAAGRSEEADCGDVASWSTPECSGGSSTSALAAKR